jgi:hypothetical protein
MRLKMAKQRKVTSILGETVDFDLMKVKRNIENRDKPDAVEMREKYIDIRRRRNPRRNVADLVTEQRSNESDARDKIQQSKKNKAEQLAKLEAEELALLESGKVEEAVEEDITVEDVVDSSPMAANASRKKIVKRSTPSDGESE